MKKVCFLMGIIFITISCSNESINEQEEFNDISLKKTKVILPNESILSITQIDNKFIKDDDYLKFKSFFDENKNLVLADFDEDLIRVFYDYQEAIQNLKILNSDVDQYSFNQKSSQIFGEVNLYDGNNSTGQQVTIRMSYGTGNKVTYQFPTLNNIRTQYNENGTAVGPVVNMNNKISSLRIRNYGLVVLYDDDWFNGSTFIFSNNPDINGQPYERSINLPSHPFSVLLNKNNVHSSVLTTVNLN